MQNISYSPPSIGLLLFCLLIANLIILNDSVNAADEPFVGRWRGAVEEIEEGNDEDAQDEEEDVGFVGKIKHQGLENETSRTSATDGATLPKPKSTAKPAVEPTIKAGMPEAKPMPDVKGKDQNLVVSYIKPQDKSYRELASVLKDSKGIDEIVAAVNEVYNFPRIEVVFDMCGEENAFYDSETRRIILCYELVAGLAEGFRQDEELTDDEVGAQVIASLIFTFFHELGHAAVDVFDLPITGNEEDAVDRFATLILLEGSSADEGDDEPDLADNAIGSFDLETAESLEDMDFADEHPVDEQRWYTMACLMVGSDPKKYEYLVGDEGLPESRAEACPFEYAKMSKSWKSLMAPHLKKA